jgi:flavodoxin
MADPVDAILIVAPGYTEEIAGIIKEKFGPNVEILALKSNHLERI